MLQRTTLQVWELNETSLWRRNLSSKFLTDSIVFGDVLFNILHPKFGNFQFRICNTVSDNMTNNIMSLLMLFSVSYSNKTLSNKVN